MSSPDTENQETQTEVKNTSKASSGINSENFSEIDNDQKGTDATNLDAARYDSNDNYEDSFFGASTADIQTLIDGASSGDKIIICNPDHEEIGPFDIGEEITIEYNYTEDCPFMQDVR
ncbi:MAG: hypothetical protein U5L09_12690 [Bacteroidales bacterium]|nr:hypothetical protein [Bacteroidales bacterium]